MNVSLIFQKKSSSSWWGFTEAPGRIVQRMMPRLTASAVKHIAVKVPINNTPWFYYDWHNTVWCKHYVFTALCAPSLPEGSEGKNLNSAMQSEPLFSRCSKWSFEDISKKEWRNCPFLIPETWSCFFFLQYVSLSLRPLTCEVKLGHRWGPQEQGCMRHHLKMSNQGEILAFLLCL